MLFYRTTVEEMENGEVAVKKKRKRSVKAKERLQKLHDKKKKNSDSMQEFSSVKGHGKNSRNYFYESVRLSHITLRPQEAPQSSTNPLT